ncbi:MAG: maleylpyruvate isomerase N-terminal domain-containing protein [Ornithinimicrobium sp.]
MAGAFTATVDGVAPGDWDLPAPPQGWVARDVVGHLTTWFQPASPATPVSERAATSDRKSMSPRMPMSRRDSSVSSAAHGRPLPELPAADNPRHVRASVGGR